MGVEPMRAREKELLALAFPLLRAVPGIKILADNIEDRLGIISFYHESIHFNLLVKLLNDRFGIQVRGGCACAGTYGHYLLQVSYEKSQEITDKINHGDLSEKPGWVRWSLHPVMTDNEVYEFAEALSLIVKNIDDWQKDYVYLNRKNEYAHKGEVNGSVQDKAVDQWFSL